MEAIAERATPRVGKNLGREEECSTTGHLRRGLNRSVATPVYQGTKLHHPTGLPCNRLHSPGHPFRSVLSSLYSHS